MKKQIVLLGFFWTSVTIATGQLLQDGVTGKFYFEKKTSETKGTPFLEEEWLPARIVLDDGLVIKNLKLKLDLVRNLPLFYRNDSAFEFIVPVKEFKLYTLAGDSLLFRKGYPASEAVQPNTYLEVLSEGKLTLLKKHSKTITISKAYNSAVALEEFTTTTPLFYLQKENRLYPLRRNRETLLRDLLKEDWTQLSDFINAQKLNLKKESDILSLVRYYNSY